MNEFILIRSAFPSREEALAVSRLLLDQRLVAASQIKEIYSLYWWEGEQYEKSEWEATLMTQESLFEKVRDYILEKHSYELPEVVATPIDKSYTEYLRWIEEYSSPS